MARALYSAIPLMSFATAAIQATYSSRAVSITIGRSGCDARVSSADRQIDLAV